MSAEPCSICGDDTAAGTSLFSGRTVVTSSGKQTFVCASCLDRLMARHPRRHYTDEETASFIDNARMAGMVGDH